MTQSVALNCTSVSPICPVEETIYGYRPNLPLNAFFIAIFYLCALVQIFLGFRYKTYFFMVVLAFGCIGEALGYGGRLIMNSNPYSSLGFKIQISCLIFSPAFIAAGIYITLKHLVLTFGESRSILRAKYYTWLFITCDWISLMMQAIGGGMAGGAGNNTSILDKGTDLMIAGIVWQVATLILFAGFVANYVIRTTNEWGLVDDEAKVLSRRRSFRGFIGAVGVAFVTVFCRCIYRVVEMVGGWANPIMRNEVGFDIMEGFMIVLATLSLTIFHPGYCFPSLASRHKKVSPVESVEPSGQSSLSPEQKIVSEVS